MTAHGEHHDATRAVLERWQEGTRERRVEERGGVLPPPKAVEAWRGSGCVAVSWAPVDGAVCYLVERAGSPEGPWAALRRSEHDLVEVAGAPVLDTSPKAGGWYRVAALEDVGRHPTVFSDPVQARDGDRSASVSVRVATSTSVGSLEAVWWMVGSERPGQLLLRDDGFGHDVRAEVLEAYRRAAEIGVTHVRAHCWLDDAFGMVDASGRLVQPSVLDEVLDLVLETGLRPIVELSFTPSALATDPSATVFTYQANVSPPADLVRYGELVAQLVRHVIERYGAPEVRQWAFEVWNEPNLAVFWTGDMATYFSLYHTVATAVKGVDPELRVGGPATAGSGWIGPFLDFVEATEAPLDFLSTHTYGGMPLDLRAQLARVGRADVPVWWTEWGVSPTHHARVNDGAFGAPFVVRGLKAAQGIAGALSYWVVSDHFEELGRPDRLAAGGFGLLTVGNVPKARWHALSLVAELPPRILATEVDGDGAGALVDAWAGTDGRRVDVLVWNVSHDAADAEGRSDLDRTVTVTLEGLEAGEWTLELTRVDQDHASFLDAVSAEEPWPQAEALATVRERAALRVEHAGTASVVDGGHIEMTVRVPMPGLVRLRARRHRSWEA